MYPLLLTDVLLSPERVSELSPSDWDILIPQSRASGLMAALYAQIERAGLLSSVPARPLVHLRSVWLVHEKQRQTLSYELRWLRRAFDETGEQMVLLKGAAYVAADLPSAAGRLMSDIDLLVPQSRIEKVEAVLNRYGWLPGEQSEYDERYYRQWMHEIPPLGHETRESTLDVHHTILPPTTRVGLEPELLFEGVVEVSEGVYVLSPSDMLLHSAAHLFHEGEFQHGLRDLWDLDRLLRLWGCSDDFWCALLEKAERSDLKASLFYGLRYTEYFFDTPVPVFVKQRMAAYQRRRPLFFLVDAMFRRAFLPDHSSCNRTFSGLAEFCLYVRSHYLRMPLRLLIPHLCRKAWMGFFGSGGSADLDARKEMQ